MKKTQAPSNSQVNLVYALEEQISIVKAMVVAAYQYALQQIEELKYFAEQE